MEVSQVARGATLHVRFVVKDFELLQNALVDRRWQALEHRRERLRRACLELGGEGRSTRTHRGGRGMRLRIYRVLGGEAGVGGDGRAPSVWSQLGSMVLRTPGNGALGRCDGHSLGPVGHDAWIVYLAGMTVSKTND